MRVAVFGHRAHAGVGTVSRYVARFLGENLAYVDSVDYASIGNYTGETDVGIFCGNWYFPYYHQRQMIRAVKSKLKVAYQACEGHIPKWAEEVFNPFDYVLVPSEWCAGFVREVYHGEVEVVPHGIDTDILSPSVRWEDRPYDVCVIAPSLSVLRKGIDIASVVHHKTQNLKWCCNTYATSQILGHSPNPATQHYWLLFGLKYRSSISEFRIHDDVELSRFYNQARFLLWSSRGEGFGLPVLEAMACGTVPIYSDAPAHREFAVGIPIPVRQVRSDTLELAPVPYVLHETNPDDYVKAIRERWDEGRELSVLARNKALQYDYRLCYRRLMDIILKEHGEGIWYPHEREMWEKYGAARVGRNWLTEPDQKERLDTLRAFMTGGTPVLDAGCGEWEATYVAPYDYAVACDLSLTALKHTKRKGFRGELVLCSVTSLPFRDGVFTRGVISEVIEHLPNIGFATQALREMGRVCKRVMLTTPDGYWADSTHRISFTRTQLELELGRSGLHFQPVPMKVVGANGKPFLCYEAW